MCPGIKVSCCSESEMFNLQKKIDDIFDITDELANQVRSAIELLKLHPIDEHIELT